MIIATSLLLLRHLNASYDGVDPASLGERRETMAKTRSAKAGFRFRSWPGVAESYIFFPVGVGDRRYLLTLEEPPPEEHLTGWLVYQEVRKGRVRDVWAIRLMGRDDGSSSPVAGHPSHAGTLYQVLAEFHRHPVNRKVEKLPALKSQKAFAWYAFDRMTERLRCGLVYPGTTIRRSSQPSVAVSLSSKWPSIGRPYPVPGAERQLLSRKAGE